MKVSEAKDLTRKAREKKQLDDYQNSKNLLENIYKKIRIAACKGVHILSVDGSELDSCGKAILEKNGFTVQKYEQDNDSYFRPPVVVRWEITW